MGATYTPDPTAHGLSADAQALDPARLANEVLIAEEVLGLALLTDLAGDAAEKAKTAVARQVNLQVRIGLKGDVTQASLGRQSTTYATSGGARIAVDPTAKRIAAQLTGPGRTAAAVRNQVEW